MKEICSLVCYCDETEVLDVGGVHLTVQANYGMVGRQFDLDLATASVLVVEDCDVLCLGFEDERVSVVGVTAASDRFYRA